MYQVKITAESSEEFYTKLLEFTDVLCLTERHWLANLSNVAALIGMNMKEINWAGFYLRSQEILILGPFWGKPACTRIPIGIGVCGTAAATLLPQLVDDVHLFPGHISCDDQSRSEIVIPFLSPAGSLLGVLDIDSPLYRRFTDEDLQGLTAILARLIAACDWTEL